MFRQGQTKFSLRDKRLFEMSEFKRVQDNKSQLYILNYMDGLVLMQRLIKPISIYIWHKQLKHQAEYVADDTLFFIFFCFFIGNKSWRQQILFFKSSPMVGKQNILCQRHLVVNTFLTHVTHMLNVRNDC